MQRQWTGKNVDLVLLTNQIGNFFAARDFEAVKGETPNGHQIIAANSPRFKLEGPVCVDIEGKPEDFVVKFDFCKKEKKRSPAIPNPMERMFFGGYFYLRKVKSEEAWMKLEKELLHYVENTVLQLTDSAACSR